MSSSSTNTLVTRKPVYTSGAYYDEKSFKWEINNFAVVYQSTSMMSAQAIQFEVGSGIGQVTKWEGHLQLTPCERSHQGNKRLGIYFKLLSKPEELKQANVSYEVIFTGTAWSIILVEKKESINLPDALRRQEGWGMIRTERTVALTDLPLTNDGKLIIDVNFKIYEAKSPSLDLTSKLKLFEFQSMHELQNQLDDKIVTLAGCKADVITKLVSKDKVEFVVNRGLISARCYAIKRLFESQSRKKNPEKVCMDDLSSLTLKVLIHYLNTGTLLEDWKCTEVLEELTSAAHKFRLKSLLEFLDDVMGSVCQDKNVKELAILAKKLELKKAQKTLFFYIKSNPALEHIMVELE